MLFKTWDDHEGELCAGLNWDRFTNAEQAKVCPTVCILWYITCSLAFYQGSLGDAMIKCLECSFIALCSHSTSLHWVCICTWVLVAI